MPEYMWAALDCPSGFAVMPLPEGKTILLGELCVQIESTVTLGAGVSWSAGLLVLRGASTLVARPCSPRMVGRWPWVAPRG